MNRLATCVAAIATLIIGAPAFAADMPVKAPPAAPTPIPTWTGFYGGIQFGGAWSDEAVNYSPNDPFAALVLGGSLGSPGEQPVANGYRIPQRGPVGGVQAGYNWQWSNWLLGIEADFSLAGMGGSASGTTFITFVPGFTPTQTITATQNTDWFGTVRGRLGWLATPNLLLFGTGGFAYGRVHDSAYYTTQQIFAGAGPGPVGACLVANVPCYIGSSSAIRTGWTAGGGIEWLLDLHWSAKVEYEFVDLGTHTVRIVSNPNAPNVPTSFNAAFYDSFNVVRLGLNYRF